MFAVDDLAVGLYIDAALGMKTGGYAFLLYTLDEGGELVTIYMSRI